MFATKWQAVAGNGSLLPVLLVSFLEVSECLLFMGLSPCSCAAELRHSSVPSVFDAFVVKLLVFPAEEQGCHSVVECRLCRQEVSDAVSR